MEYKFTTKINLDDTVYIINTEEKFDVLSRFSDAYWTSQKVQKIIENIDQSRDKEKSDEYNWASEDVEVNANKNGVWLYDWLAHRGKEEDAEKLNLFLTHDDFITFLEDFKDFIEENS